MKTNEWLKYLQRMEKEFNDYRELPDIEFYKLYIDEDLDYAKETEWYSTEELEEYLYDISDKNREYISNCYEVELYKSENYIFAEIQLAWGWPSVYININTRWQTAELEYIYCWTEKLNLSYMFENLCDIYWIEY